MENPAVGSDVLSAGLIIRTKIEGLFENIWDKISWNTKNSASQAAEIFAVLVKGMLKYTVHLITLIKL